MGFSFKASLLMKVTIKMQISWYVGNRIYGTLRTQKKLIVYVAHAAFEYLLKQREGDADEKLLLYPVFFHRCLNTCL